MKGSTAVTPAPILHEFQDDSSRSNANEQSASVRTTANSEGLLVVMPHATSLQTISDACDPSQAGTHTTEVLNQLLPNLSQSQVIHTLRSLALRLKVSAVILKSPTVARIAFETSRRVSK